MLKVFVKNTLHSSNANIYILLGSTCLFYYFMAKNFPFSTNGNYQQIFIPFRKNDQIIKKKSW